MSVASLKDLLPFRVSRREPAIRLVCFPFSGGSASIYRDWNTLLPDRVDVCAVELPGRGNRVGQTPISEMDLVVSTALSELSALPPLPTLYFGHSLGGRIAFASALKDPGARMVIAAGSRPPHVAYASKRAALPRDALMRELRKLGGTPEEVLADDDLMDLFLPVIRADLWLLETFTPSTTVKVSCPLVTLAAKDDAESPFAEAASWAEHTAGPFTLLPLAGGGHFFILTRKEEVLGHVRSLLANIT